MSHIALYRAWRPRTFRDMVGQQHIVQTLQNAIREERISHAYLFNGPRGTGKTTTAKVFAKAVNCERGPAVEPCNECAACKGIASGQVMDVVEIDAASNRGIDEIRDIRDKVRYAPTDVRYKVYIIDEVHMLTSEAFNALLKTLEEPPGHVIFILATTEPHKLPATIVSRCQRFDFRQISLEEQKSRLDEICRTEGISADDDALAYIARLSEGGMRDAISLLEQVAAFSGERITLESAVDVTGGLAAEQFYQLAEAIRDRDVARMMPLVEGLMQAGKSAEKSLENLMYYFRDLLVLKLAPGSGAVTDRIVDPARFRDMAEAFSAERLFSMIDILNRYGLELKAASQPQTLFEVALMKLCSLGDAPSGGAQPAAAERSAAASNAGGSDEELSRLRSRVEALERKLEQALKNGAGMSAPAASPDAGKRTGSGGRGVFGSASGRVRPKVKLEPYLAAASSPETNQARMNWGDVLQRVREEKVTLHAWLKDGELVSVADGNLLIAFRNEIHRETTEKPAHRELIERVVQQTLGKPLQLVTVMQKDWQAAQSGSTEAGGGGGEALELVPEQGEGSASAPNRPEWVEEAIKLFGEDLVVVQDKD